MLLRSWPQRTNNTVRLLLRGIHDERWPGWEVVIGIETHAQIKSQHKLFSNSPTPALKDAPNTSVTPFDVAFPGTLPSLNQECVDLALRTAVALNADIQPRSSFDRKHYFYPDLPAGYQITQHYEPIAVGGTVALTNRNSAIRINQIQLEQDTAKTTFDPRTRTSSIDLNRAGSALMEIVTEPDIRSPEEAGMYVRTLQSILRAVGASDGNMETGSLRCDVNVSINRAGEPLGTRCEIKNLNSVKFMQSAILYEIERHRALYVQGATVQQETRGFNQDTFETFPMRSKEDAPDYRYMPDPNLGVLLLPPQRIERIRRTLPELPWATRARLIEVHGLSEKDADVLLAEEMALAYFNQVCVDGRNPRLVFNWMIHELLGRLHSANLAFSDNPITSRQLGEVVDLVQSGMITGASGKLLLRDMLASPSASISVAERARSLSLLSDPTLDLDKLCLAAITALPSEATAFQTGANKNVLNKILGWVIRESKGRVDTEKARERLAALLEGH
ncbi:Glutamyl-tRNA(Gln) amidotransferase subunit B, mitochondrial [Mycena indigotica]|uniref:Glutamyl-tRNA(Gln) amidotransferase subunit B, mitochondrial n=1 Tax=Mycena indigotica TaxID=2126181 RepID=A0A8H6VYW6_9AGAR|nr:Glutamyl-tRNA(Gln) amidotransferase subunit B, mitochondrial [Mycena indigotica]KAF7299249.1 Glutamyl-tRNA(Gln) amidotransferase subunit B, mitochondrial [Mycena indigotica]